MTDHTVGPIGRPLRLAVGCNCLVDEHDRIVHPCNTHAAPHGHHSPCESCPIATNDRPWHCPATCRALRAA